MDKTLKLKLKDFEKALASLRESLATSKTEIVRDATIKRFEYCFELLWKTSKIFLYFKFGRDAFSPKECFRELRKNNLVSDEEAESLLMMTDDRNEIIHNYNEEFADELYSKIKRKYFKLIEKVLKLLTN